MTDLNPVSGVFPANGSSPLATSLVADGTMRDAILLKTALEGKDFQTARQEVISERAEEGQKPSSSTPEQRSLSGIASTDEAYTLEISSLQVTELDLSVNTPAMSLELHATQVNFIQVQASVSQTAPSKDPLVLDMNGSGPQTTGLSDGRGFDLDGDGQIDQVSFVTGGSAFLALDRNGDGQINSGLELFGDQHGALDGYEELRKFDADRNGRIDVSDPVYSNLQLLYGNGSQTSLSQSGVTSIQLNPDHGAGLTPMGDRILRSGTASLKDGSQLRTYAMALQSLDQLA